ncbi:MAG: hypothetical protein IAE79_22890 [Anaerolinea sp.]|nr:hypothetical protein [Anaerolinea sp.]
MKLPEQDAKLFFDLMWSLQFYVKQRLHLLPEVQTVAAYSVLAGETRLEVRNALWDNPQFIAEYVQANPDKLPAAQLDIVAQWQHFVRGDFFIERMLKKHAIFIQGEKVYGVLGLYDALDDMFHKQMLPVYGKTVLLPFKDVVVYDGLISTYSIFFGGGIKGNLKELYNKAKQRGEIIVSFAGGTPVQLQDQFDVELKDWQPTLAALAEGAKSLRAQTGSPPSWGPAFSLLKASIEMAQTAVTHPENQDALWDSYNKITKAVNRLEKGIDYS